MGNIILSKSKRVAHPYYAQELGIHLYTGEELCYYIYNNIMLLNDGFIEDRLYDFIEATGYAELSEKLKKWQGNSELWELLIVILQDIHYYDDAEIEAFKTEAERISNEGYEGVYKDKANYFLKIDKVYDALRIYDKLLSSKNIKSDSDKAELFSLIGAAFTRLFEYDRAVKAFKKSYELSGDLNQLMKIYMACKIAGDKGTGLYPEQFVRDAFGDDYDKYVALWNAEFEVIKSKVSSEDKLVELASLKDKDARKRRSGYLKAIEECKQAYSRGNN